MMDLFIDATLCFGKERQAATVAVSPHAPLKPVHPIPFDSPIGSQEDA